MNQTQYARYCDFRTVQAGLAEEDCTEAEDFQLWATQWISYVKYGGDRPPVKPPRPAPQP